MADAGEQGVALLAVNEAGHESGLETMSALGDLALLQDTDETNAWESWDVTYRDVVILDADNVRIGVFNLTDNDLSDAENYARLKAMLLEAK